MTDLKLDNDEDIPRRLVPFPDGHLVAYGDDNGTLTCIDTNASSSKEKVVVRTFRTYDDAAVRAVAVSSDGQRVAVGFDNGETRLYQYDEYDYTDKTQGHPFVPKKSSNTDGASDNEDDDDDFGGNAFLSQHDRDDDNEDDDDNAEGRSWAGPQLEGPIRDLTFLPKSHMLAISSESGLCVVNVTSAETMADRYLQKQVEKEHDSGGIRGVSVSSDRTKLLASLAMDGRLCVWKASGLDQLKSPTDEIPVKREENCCVPKRDVGEITGADPSDRSCLPHFVKPTVLALPGKDHLQLRSVSLLGEKVMIEESEQEVNSDPSKGHIDSIVALTSFGEHVISSGRDGRVVLWSLADDEEGNLKAHFVQKLGEFESVPTSLYWNENDNILYIACANGSLELVKNMHKKIQKMEASQEVTKGAAKKTTDSKSVLESSTSGKNAKKSKVTFDDSDSENDEEMGKPSEKKNTATTKAPNDGDDDDDDIHESDKDNDFPGSPDKSSKVAPSTQMDMDDNSDDDSLGPETQPPQSRATATSDVESDDDDASTKKSPTKKLVKDAQATPASESPDKSIGSEDEFSLKDASPIALTTAAKSSSASGRLSKQFKPLHEESDDEGDIFDDKRSDGTEAPKPASKNTFIDDEAEDVNDEDENASDAMAEEPTPEKSADKPATTSNDIASPAQDIDQEKAATGSIADISGADNDQGFANYNNDDSEDENSMADDVANFRKNYQESRAGVVLPEPQAPFAPSSTPLDLERRYLCWNSVGSATSSEEIHIDENGTKSVQYRIDITFRNSGQRRPIRIKDRNDHFILGSLGDDGAIFATDLKSDDDDLDDDEDMTGGLSGLVRTKAALKKSQKQRARNDSAGGSKIFFHRYEAFTKMKDKDWHFTLPDGERVLGCASGLGWAAAVTSRKFLRLFTTGGAQEQMIWLPGDPVTVVGSNRFLAVFYHESMPLQDGTQKLGCMLYDSVSNRTITKGPVSCISAGSSLSWAGFSDDCSLVAMDSDGMISMLIATSIMENGANDCADSLVQPASWEWAPMLDTIGLRKSSDDSFWPVTVYNGKLVCVPLKGGIQYPDAARQPVTSALDFKMPFAKSTIYHKKSMAKLEETLVRSHLALTQKKVNNDLSNRELLGEEFEEEYDLQCRNLDKATLKFFDTTVKYGKLERAWDLVGRLHLEKSYEIAMQLADQHDKLVDLIEEAKEIKFGGPLEDGEGDEAFDDQGDYESDAYDDNQLDHRSSPPNSRPHSSQKISPEVGLGKSKRSLDETFGGRNVRPKAY